MARCDQARKLGFERAVQLQVRLADRVDRQDRVPAKVEWVAGADVAYVGASGGLARAAVVVCDAVSLDVVERVVTSRPVEFPYAPGLLSMRECPVILAALGEVQCGIDVLLVDGHGIAHPRRFGLACHVGVLTGLATVGIAKRILCGDHAPLPEPRGSWQPLVDRGRVVGAVLRTRTGVRPVYVSVGHRITLKRAVELTVASAPRFRIPEPIRAADRVARGTM